MLVDMCKCAKILGLFVTPSISHQQTFQEVCKGLAQRGHDVIFISPNVLNDNIVKSLTQIDLHYIYATLKTHDPNKYLSKDASTYRRVLGYYELGRIPTELVFQDERVIEILNYNTDFDAIIVQAFHPLVFAVAAKFQVPIIGEFV